MSAEAASRDISVVIAGDERPTRGIRSGGESLPARYAVLLAGFGHDDEHARLCQRARGAVTPVFEHVDRIPYLGLQQMSDVANAWGLYCYNKALHLDELTDEAIAVIVEQIPWKTSPMTWGSMFVPFGGRLSKMSAPTRPPSAPPAPAMAYFAIGLTNDPRPAARGAGLGALVLAGAATPRPRHRQLRQRHGRLDDDRIRASYGPTNTHGSPRSSADTTRTTCSTSTPTSSRRKAASQADTTER